MLHDSTLELSFLTALKGGNAVWGNATHAPDDDHPSAHSRGELIAFRVAESGSTESMEAIKNRRQSERQKLGFWDTHLRLSRCYSSLVIC